jgi:hypothetical protein
MKLLLVLFASVAVARADFTNVTFTWKQAPEERPAVILGYRFYEKPVGGDRGSDLRWRDSGRILLGTTDEPFFTVTNWPMGRPRVFVVTSFNALWEGPESRPFIGMPIPGAPEELEPLTGAGQPRMERVKGRVRERVKERVKERVHEQLAPARPPSWPHGR